jgi:hypothetical protein
VLISIYILKTGWSGRGWWIAGLQYFWIGFPYVMAVAVGVAPAFPLHRSLLGYKRTRDAALRDGIARARLQLESAQSDAARQKELREVLAFQLASRKELYEMRTWPYDLEAKVKSLAVLGANLYASSEAASKFIERTTFPG